MYMADLVIFFPLFYKKDFDKTILKIILWMFSFFIVLHHKIFPHFEVRIIYNM